MNEEPAMQRTTNALSVNESQPVGGGSSPIGSPHRDGSRRRAQRSAAYREERRRIAPYEGIARLVIARRQALD